MRFKDFLIEEEKTITINLGGSPTKTQALLDFIDEYENNTKSHPWQHSMRIWKDSVGIELSKWQGNIHISSIMTFVGKNEGKASIVLNWLCELADKHGVTMDLEVEPIKNAGAREGKSLNKTQLRSWYKRHGFVTQGGDFMLRKPTEK